VGATNQAMIVVVLAAAVDLAAVLMLVDWLGLTVSLGPEIPFQRKYYYVPGTAAADERRVLFDPWPVQPRATLGLVAELP